MNTPLSLTPDQASQWKQDIDQARNVRKQAQKWWDANLAAYAPKPSDDPEAYGGTLNTNRDFTLVERKKADLFYQQPDVQAMPSPLMQGQEQMLDWHTSILNAKLGVFGVDAKDLAHRMLFDVLCTAGTGFGVMGYESATVNVPTINPMTQQQVMAPVPVYEELFWRYLSPRQVLIPSSFRSTRWDDAPWLGYEFEWPIPVAKAKGWIGDDFKGSSPDEQLYFDYKMSAQPPQAVARGIVIFYKSALMRPERPHPLHQTRIVFIEGIEQPVEHVDSPYQKIAPDGSLTPDSLIGFPIHPLTLRPMSDSAYIPADCTISRPIVNELNRFRGQMVEQRDANVLRWSYNTDVLSTDALTKIVNARTGAMIGIPGEAFVGEGAIKELPHGQYPRENFQFNDYLDNDLARTHALDANQAGVETSGDQTATEANIRQSNTNARLGLERGVTLDWYIRGVTKYSTLVQRFLSLKEATAILGQAPAAQWDTWRKTVPATLGFTALPDSALRHDLASERKRALDEYAFFAKDPLINHQALLEHLLPKLHYPPNVLVTTPPPPHPEPPKITLSIGAADLDPLTPAYPNLYQILTQQGIQNLSPPSMDPVTAHLVQQQSTVAPDGQPKHPGKVAPAESLSKHQVEQTGGMPNTGHPVGGVM